MNNNSGGAGVSTTAGSNNGNGNNNFYYSNNSHPIFTKNEIDEVTLLLKKNKNRIQQDLNEMM